jgi:hypothetical protein
LRQAEALVDAALADYNPLFAEQVTAFRQQVEALGIELLPEKEPLTR